jgi:hypothetical protein
MPLARACRAAAYDPRHATAAVRRPALPPAGFAPARMGCLQ